MLRRFRLRRTTSSSSSEITVFGEGPAARVRTAGIPLSKEEKEWVQRRYEDTARMIFKVNLSSRLRS